MMEADRAPHGSSELRAARGQARTRFSVTFSGAWLVLVLVFAHLLWAHTETDANEQIGADTTVTITQTDDVTVAIEDEEGNPKQVTVTVIEGTVTTTNPGHTAIKKQFQKWNDDDGDGVYDPPVGGGEGDSWVNIGNPEFSGSTATGPDNPLSDKIRIRNSGNQTGLPGGYSEVTTGDQIRLCVELGTWEDENLDDEIQPDEFTPAPGGPHYVPSANPAGIPVRPPANH